MLGKHFIYILVRKDRMCLKVGITSDFRRRMRSLQRRNGPFCKKTSLALRCDTRQQARGIENSIRSIFFGSRIEIPKKKHRNGEKEWFTIESYGSIISAIQNASTNLHGTAGRFQSIDFPAIAPLLQEHKLELRRFKRALLKIVSQINAKAENTKNELIFKKFLDDAITKMEGIAKIKEANGLHEKYELYFPSKTFTKDQLRSLMKTTGLLADSKPFWGAINFSSSCEINSSFQKTAFRFPIQDRTFEHTWEARGYIQIYRSLLSDLADSFPLPAKFASHVGKSMWDNISPEEFRRAIRNAFGGNF